MGGNIDMPNRILDKIVKEKGTECWKWTGAVFQKPYGNYGQLRFGTKVKRAHRVSYEFYKGTIKRGLEIDHLCHNTLCVNPDHLEAVTHTENMQRRKDSRLPECRYGHKYTAETTYIRPSNGRRECISCRKLRHLMWYSKNICVSQ